MIDERDCPPVKPGVKPTSDEVRQFAVNGRRAPDHTLMTSSVTLAVALCGMLAAILVPYITGRQQMALTLAILNAQRDQNIVTTKNAERLITVADETKAIATKVDGVLTRALSDKAVALEQVSDLKPGNIGAKTRAQVARKEAIPPPEKTPVATPVAK